MYFLCFFLFLGLKDIIIGEMFCDFVKLVVFECMDFFDFVIKVVIEFKIKVDVDKMFMGFIKLV